MSAMAVTRAQFLTTSSLFMSWGKPGRNCRPDPFSYSCLTERSQFTGLASWSPPLLTVVMNKKNTMTFFSFHTWWYLSLTCNEIDSRRPISHTECAALMLNDSSLSHQCFFPFSFQYSATFDRFASRNHLLLLHRDLPPHPDILIRCGSRVGQSLPSPPLPSHDRGCDWFFNIQSRQLTYLGMCPAAEVVFEGIESESFLYYWISAFVPWNKWGIKGMAVLDVVIKWVGSKMRSFGFKSQS